MKELEKILERKEINAIKDIEEENERCNTACEGCCSDIEDGECNCRDALIIHIIEKMAERMNDGWIPVEERLPEKEYDTVLCVTDKNYYLVCVYNKEIGFRTSDFLVEGEIVAWRPLPELYQPERRI